MLRERKKERKNCAKREFPPYLCRLNMDRARDFTDMPLSPSLPEQCLE